VTKFPGTEQRNANHLSFAIIVRLYLQLNCLFVSVTLLLLPMYAVNRILFSYLATISINTLTYLLTYLLWSIRVTCVVR